MVKMICLAIFSVAVSLCIALHAQVSDTSLRVPRTGFTLNISMENESQKVEEIGSVIVKEKNVTDHLVDENKSMSSCLGYRMDVLREGVQVPAGEVCWRRIVSHFPCNEARRRV
jgi:hypothetical protein